MSEQADNPCLACGACCMSFRVSFYCAEVQMIDVVFVSIQEGFKIITDPGYHQTTGG